MDFEFDPKDILYFRIDRKKKLPITTILYALGFTKEKIIETFYTTNKYSYDTNKKYWVTDFNPENYKRPIKISYDLIDSTSGKTILSKGEKLNIVIARKLQEKGLKSIVVLNEEIVGKYLSKDIKDNNGQNIIGAGFDITEDQLNKIISQEEKILHIVNIDPINKGPYILESLKIDKNKKNADYLNSVSYKQNPDHQTTKPI